MPDRPVAPGSATRLLVLGAVRIFQPVHGYFVRRELASWQVGDWASIHPGSVYNALRRLSDGGLLEEASTGQQGSGPARTAYRLTARGESEFAALLGSALRQTVDPALFLVGIGFASSLTRDEALEAVGEHLALLERGRDEAEAATARVLESAETPDTASEVSRILAARAEGQAVWARDYLDRVRRGAYAFRGEPPGWRPTAGQVRAARAAGAHLPLDDESFGTASNQS